MAKKGTSTPKKAEKAEKKAPEKKEVTAIELRDRIIAIDQEIRKDRVKLVQLRRSQDFEQAITDANEFLAEKIKALTALK